MPTLYSKCKDCVSDNIKFNEEIEIADILSKFLPEELILKIIRFSYSYTRCFMCHQIICKKHTVVERETIGNFGTIDVDCCLDCKKKLVYIF